MGLGPVGQPAEAQIPEASAPAKEHVNPFAMPSLSDSITAGQAEGAPMYTAEAGNGLW